MQHQLKLTKYSHYFKCTDSTEAAKSAIYSFVKHYLIKEDIQRDGRGIPIGKTHTVFSAATADRSEFRIHINLLDKFIAHMRLAGIKVEEIYILDVPPPEADLIDIELQEKWNLRDDQVPIVNYLTDSSGALARFVGIQPGGGKTLCSTAAVISFSKRFIVMVKPMYIDKWVADIVKISNLKEEEILVVKGGPQLKKFLHLCEEPNGLDHIKAVVIANATLRVWLTLYEKHGEDSLILGYAFTPDRLFEKARAGIRLIDELHQDFHLNYKFDLYTNVQRSISLSGSLVSDEAFMDKVYRTVHPLETRYNGGALDKYTASFGVTYNIEARHRIRTSEFNQSSYSHNAFEKSILRSPELFLSYAEMIKVYVDLGYIKSYEKGRKAVIFASTKDMCTRLTYFFQKTYPHLDIRRYVDEDPYANLNEPDIRITTVLSAGTAHDIPNLTAAFLTIAQQSVKANIQVFGRLRKIVGYTPRFFFFSCLDVPKHMKYHKDKIDIMRERAVSFASYPYSKTL